MKQNLIKSESTWLPLAQEPRGGALPCRAHPCRGARSILEDAEPSTSLPAALTWLCPCCLHDKSCTLATRTESMTSVWEGRAWAKGQWQADTAPGHGALQRISEKEARFSQHNINVNIMYFTSGPEHGHSRVVPAPPHQLQEQMLREERESKGQHSNTCPEHAPSLQRFLGRALPDPACSSVFNTLSIFLSPVYHLLFQHHQVPSPLLHLRHFDFTLTTPKLKLKSLADTEALMAAEKPSQAATPALLQLITGAHEASIPQSSAKTKMSSTGPRGGLQSAFIYLLTSAELLVSSLICFRRKLIRQFCF